MPKDSRQTASEIHNLPEHAHEIASVRPDKAEHLSPHEATRHQNEETILERMAAEKQKLETKKRRKQGAAEK